MREKSEEIENLVSTRKIEELKDLYESDVIQALKDNKFTEIYETQWECVQTSVKERKNTILSLPTGSGKTFPAMLTAIHHIISKKGKVIYTVPLKALAREKYNTFEKIMKPLDIKVAINTGDYAKSDFTDLGSNDLIIATTEKVDSLIRHNEQWLFDVSLFIIDEIHTIEDKERGLTLELVVSEIKRKYRGAQILALSAVVGNPKEIAKWLDGECIEDKKRLVQLRKGVMEITGSIQFHNYSKYNFNISLRKPLELYTYSLPKTDPNKRLRYSHTIDLVKHYVNQKKQCIVFTNSRKNSEDLALAIAKDVKLGGYSINDEDAMSSANNISDSIDEKNDFWDCMIECLKSGVCFHHAGIPLVQRELIEDQFTDSEKQGIMVIVATPTLSQGINFPANVVILADCIRWGGSDWINLSVNEVINMMGRAGRPRYHDYGESVLIEDESLNKNLDERYIIQDPTDILSELRYDRLRRKYLNGLISANKLLKKRDIIEYFSKTFYAILYKERLEDWKKMEDNILEDIAYLEERELIQRTGDYFYSTELGRIVSDSCIDCETGIHFYQSAKKLIEYKDKIEQLSPWHIFQVLLLSPEVPIYRPYDPHKGLALALEENEKSFLLTPIPRNQPSELEKYGKSSLAAKLMYYWIDEKEIGKIIKRYPEIRPHDLVGYGEMIEWLGDAFTKISYLLNIPENVTTKILSYCNRARYGVREELLDIVRIVGVGRKSARKLYDNGITYEALMTKSMEELKEVVGAFMAKKIREHFETIEEKGEEVAYDEENIYREMITLQKENIELERQVVALESNQANEDKRITKNELKMRLTKIKEYCEEQLGYVHADAKYFRFFTNHGTAHSRKVHKRLDELIDELELKEGPPKLTEYEYFILVVSAWCHDLGMLPQSGENFDDIEILKNVRENHPKRIEKYLRNNWRRMGIADEAERHLIEIICKSHSGDVDFSDLQINEEMIVDGKLEVVRTHLLAVLLRLADELDIGEHRLPPIESRNHPEISKLQKEIYIKNEIVKKIVIDHERHRIIVQMLIEEEFEDEDKIIDSIKDKFNKELDLVKDILSTYGIELADIKFIETKIYS